MSQRDRLAKELQQARQRIAEQEKVIGTQQAQLDAYIRHVAQLEGRLSGYDVVIGAASTQVLEAVDNEGVGNGFCFIHVDNDGMPIITETTNFTVEQYKQVFERLGLSNKLVCSETYPGVCMVTG